MEKQVEKEIVTDDGHVYELKRPFHRQGWFWVALTSWFVSALLFLTLVGFFILNTVLTAAGGNMQEYLDREIYYQNAESYDEHEVGETVTLEDGIKMTVESIQQEKARPLADDGVGYAIVVRVKLENNTSRAVHLNPYYFSLFDATGDVYVLDASTFEKNAWMQQITPGRSVSLDLVFDGEGSDEERYNLIYNDEIRWWQELETLGSGEGRL